MSHIKFHNEESTSSKNDFRHYGIAKLSIQALNTPDLEIFNEIVFEIVKNNLKTEFVNFLKFDQKNTNTVASFEGMGWTTNIKEISFTDFDSFAQYSLLIKKPVKIIDLQIEKNFTVPQILIDSGIQSGISVLVYHKDQKPYGILGAYSSEKMNFTTSDENFLINVSFILSSAIIQNEILNQLRNEEENASILLEFATDPILIFDENGKILKANSRFCEITGYSKDEILDKNASEFYLDSEKDKFQLKIQALQEGQNIKFERPLLKKDNKVIIVDVHAKMLPNKTFQSIYRDITSRIENEELFRIAQKMEAIGRISGGIAHDFNNYLSVISGYVENLSNINFEQLEEESWRNDLTQIKKTVEKASLMIKNLFDFSRQRNLNSGIINVNELISEMRNSIKSFFGEQIKVIFDLDKNISLTQVNPNHLQQSILNLLINSKDSLETANKEAKIIMIKTFNYSLKHEYGNYSFNAHPGEYIAISIKDNGIGLTSQIKSHLFEPFFTTKTSDKGTGLGLASVYGFTKGSNGFILVDGKEAEGADFTICLPKTKESVIDTRETLSKKLAFKNKKISNILLVDDNDDLRELLRTILEKNNFLVKTATNGKKALEILKNRDSNIDLLITDAVMPEMDGIELINNLGELKTNKKIILMTGFSLKGPQQFDYPVEIKYLIKPFPISSLLTMIKEIEA